MKIERLSEDVVNRIAAGEVIQRPFNAIKELIENSVDAGASSIQILVEEGGLKLLQITDNGHGISKEDFPLLCHRFSTSKLRQFDDLYRISSFGFRGEALASISFASKLTITSRTKDSNHAIRATFVDGQMTANGSKACAGNIGTVIQIEDLFYNSPIRKKAMKTSNEEYVMILGIVQKFALCKTGIAFSIRKTNSVNPDLITNYSSTQLDVIRQIYGNSVADELMILNEKNDELEISCKGYISNTNFNVKKVVFLLFINDCPALKKSLEFLYSEFLPKGTHPFILLSLQISPKLLDVNIHPTKCQVHFLNEDEILRFISKSIRDRLSQAVGSRSFTFTKMQKNVEQVDSKVYVSPSNKIRVDSNNRTLESFKHRTAPIELQIPKKRRIFKLKSLQNLKEELEKLRNEETTKIIREIVFVGLIDYKKCLAQSGTKLYLLDLEVLLINLLYQVGLDQFGNFSVRAVQLQKSDVVSQSWDFLLEKKEILKEYFGIELDLTSLTSLPVLNQAFSCIEFRFADFANRLHQKVDWTDEEQCFKGILKELSFLFCPIDSNAVDSEFIASVVIPEIKKHLICLNTRAMKSAIIELTDVKDLYKIFERC